MNFVDAVQEMCVVGLMTPEQYNEGSKLGDKEARTWLDKEFEWRDTPCPKAFGDLYFQKEAGHREAMDEYIHKLGPMVPLYLDLVKRGHLPVETAHRMVTGNAYEVVLDYYYDGTLNSFAPRWLVILGLLLLLDGLDSTEIDPVVEC